MDGYCPYCRKNATFVFEPVEVTYGQFQVIKSRIDWDKITLTCTRDREHSLLYFIHVDHLVIQKIGQLPSVADIAIDETRQKYRSVLKGDNWSELYKAIGLAAHGEGIGSFVYLRRVFERLVKSRFEEHKKEKGWKDDQFQKLRMDEKIEFLKEYLPDYLVQIRKVYSIFSLGIHELDNKQCLEFFKVGKGSIIFILEEDLKKQEEEKIRKEFTEAIAKFTPETRAVDKVSQQKR